MQPLHAWVDVGSLILVDPAGGIHSGSPSVLMRQLGAAGEGASDVSGSPGPVRFWRAAPRR
jgi:hypothetical protein